MANTTTIISSTQLHPRPDYLGIEFLVSSTITLLDDGLILRPSLIFNTISIIQNTPRYKLLRILDFLHDSSPWQRTNIQPSLKMVLIWHDYVSVVPGILHPVQEILTRRDTDIRILNRLLLHIVISKRMVVLSRKENKPNTYISELNAPGAITRMNWPPLLPLSVWIEHRFAWKDWTRRLMVSYSHIITMYIIAW